MINRRLLYLLLTLLVATPLLAQTAASPADHFHERVSALLQLLHERRLLPETGAEPEKMLNQILTLAGFPEGVRACLSRNDVAAPTFLPEIIFPFRDTPCAYIKLRSLTADSVTNLMDKLDKTAVKGWLIDLRDCRSLETGQANKLVAAIPADQPCVVLINRLTVGETELLAAQVSQRERALCLGEATAGLREGARQLLLSDGFSLPIPSVDRTPLWQPLIPDAPLPSESAAHPDQHPDSWVSRAFVMLRVIMASEI